MNIQNYHSAISPSGWDTWSTCSAKRGLLEELELKNGPIDTTNIDSFKGTVLHDIGYSVLSENTVLNDHWGEYHSYDSDTNFVIEYEMLEGISVYIDYVNDLIFEMEEGEYLLEEKLDLSFLNLEGLEKGTVDAAVISFTRKAVEIVDYKNGIVDVDVTGNGQLRIYMIGMLNYLKNVDLTNWIFKITIVQPNSFSGGGDISSEEFSLSDIQDWRVNVLEPAARLCYSRHAVYKPSEKACNYCDCAPHCEALAKFVDNNLPMPVSENLLKPIAVSTMTPEQKAFVVSNKAVITKFMEKVENSVTEEVKKGNKKYRGLLKLVEKSTKRRFLPGVDDRHTTPLLAYMDVDDAFNTKIKGIGEIEKQLLTNRTKGEVEKIMKRLIFKPKGGLKVVNINDKREEFNGLTKIRVSDFDHLM